MSGRLELGRALIRYTGPTYDPARPDRRASWLKSRGKEVKHMASEKTEKTDTTRETTEVKDAPGADDAAKAQPAPKTEQPKQ